MPRVKTTNGRSIEFIYELAVPKGSESPTELVKITPEGNNLTADQARVVCIMYDEVQVVPESIVEPLTPEPVEAIPTSNSTYTCVSCPNKYKTYRGLTTHIANKH